MSRRQGTIQEQFERFHAENPHVYDELVRLARRAVERDVLHIGIELLICALRWNSALKTNGKPFKLDQRFSSRYARLIMEQEPDLEDLFYVRKLRAL